MTRCQSVSRTSWSTASIDGAPPAVVITLLVFFRDAFEGLYLRVALPRMRQGQVRTTAHESVAGMRRRMVHGHGLTGGVGPEAVVGVVCRVAAEVCWEPMGRRASDRRQDVVWGGCI